MMLSIPPPTPSYRPVYRDAPGPSSLQKPGVVSTVGLSPIRHLTDVFLVSNNSIMLSTYIRLQVYRRGLFCALTTYPDPES